MKYLRVVFYSFFALWFPIAVICTAGAVYCLLFVPGVEAAPGSLHADIPWHNKIGCFIVLGLNWVVGLHAWRTLRPQLQKHHRP